MSMTDETRSISFFAGPLLQQKLFLDIFFRERSDSENEHVTKKNTEHSDLIIVVLTIQGGVYHI